MELWRSAPVGRLHWAAFFVLLALAAAAGCRRDDTIAVDRNRPPETFVTEGPEPSSNPTDPIDLFYRAHLYWRGEDRDGTVEGFRWALDDTTDPGAWNWTTATDSLFRFDVAEIGAKEHLFLIRSVDDLGKEDPSPDTLRFESFTTANPVIDLSKVTVTAQQPNLGPVTGLTSGDTVEVFSDVTICWDGGDADGYVVGWESKFDDETAWTSHALDDKCRSFTRLSPGLHRLSLRAVDDAGAKSTDIVRVAIQSDFDPETTLNTASIAAILPRPWRGDTLHIGPGLSEPDTLPLGATISLDWTSTDKDGPVVRYTFNFGGIAGATTALSVDTDTTGAPDPNDPMQLPTPQPLRFTDLGSGLPFFVKGIDIYGNVEQRPDTVFMYVNFPPTVAFDPSLPDPVNVVTGAPVQFPFSGDDKDSDPTKLAYQWQFSFENTPSQAIDLPESQLYVLHSFVPSEVGDHTLTVWAQDPSGSVRRSAPDIINVHVTVPEPRGGTRR